MPQFSEARAGSTQANSFVFAGAYVLLRLPPMRLLALVVVAGLAAGCGSVLNTPDGGGGAGAGSAGSTGSGGGGTTGTGGGGGTTGSGGAGGIVCIHNGVGYPAGAPFPAGDGCNTCSCSANGQAACTLIACQPDCVFDSSYRFGETGGLVAYEEMITLAPPASYRHTRTPRLTDPPDVTCAPALPPCNSADGIDVADIMRDIGNADVQKALAMASPPLYGRDTRPVDGSVFELRREDGRGFLVGFACGSVGTGCVEHAGRHQQAGRTTCARWTSSSSRTRAARRCASRSAPQARSHNCVVLLDSDVEIILILVRSRRR